MRDNDSTIVKKSQEILQSALVALREGNTSEVLEYFDDHFTFNDRTLHFEFTDKPRLKEFFENSRELFPGTTRETVFVLGEEDHAVALWKLSAAQTFPYSSISYRSPISLFGSTIVHVEN
jgi:hypothetical protein